MNSSKLPPEVSINIINSSNFLIDGLTSVLRAQISSGKRPHVACLTQEELLRTENPLSFLKNFIEEKLVNRQMILEKSQKIKEFNQLNEWMKEVELKGSNRKKEKRSSNGIKDGIRNQSTAMKRDCAQNAIIDFPLKFESIKLYLILFDVYDFELIKSLISFDSSLKTIVNLFPRDDVHKEMIPIRNAEFWKKLIYEKSAKAFNDVAFIDLDVPLESQHILNLRSKLIYDQFCHFFYDIEDVKSSYKTFYERFEMVEMNAEHNVSVNNLNGRLDKIPKSLITVEVIYDAILDEIVNDEDEIPKSLLKSRFPFQVEVYGKIFTDFNDTFGVAFHESPKFYVEQMQKLEDALHLWDNIENVSLEKRQLLNHFMGKVLKALGGERGGFDHLEFYFYALQLRAMDKVSEKTSTAKNFYENRCVGREKQPKLIKTSVSDSVFDYNNQPKVPFEISQLVWDKEKLEASQVEEEDLQVHMFSPPAMIQLLSQLMQTSRASTRRHCQLFDVILMKFHKQSIPKMFISRSYEKVLPTPLCFRDFNDFEKHYLKHETQTNRYEEASFSEDDSNSVHEKLEDFILKDSLKHEKKMHEARGDEKKSETEMLEEKSEKVNEKSAVMKDLYVFNISNKRIQFHLTESEFNSVHLQVKASTFEWMNHLGVLNISCEMHDLFLSISHDLNLFENNLQLITLSNSEGVICCLDMNPNVTAGTQHLFNRWNFSISFPNGCAIKNLNEESVEQHWVETEKSPDGEARRVVFSNGFVMIVFVDGVKRVLSPNGTIFEVNPNAKPSKNFASDKEATNHHLDSITSIHFLKKFIDPPKTFKLLLPSGEKFLVENDLIVGKIESIQLREMFNQTTGSLHISRDDGVKMLHTEAFTKCLFPDGTLITTWLDDESIETAIDDVKDINEPILDRIWSTESKNESKFVVHQILNHIDDDYFFNINANHQVEHKNYGSVHFDRSMKSIHVDNCGMKFHANLDNGLLVMNNRGVLKIDESQIRLMGEKCSKCVSSNEVAVNILKANDGGNEKLFTARDFAGNTFVIRKNGKHIFYSSETHETQKCQSCKSIKGNYEFDKFGERSFVVNRDSSGYEIFSSSSVTKITKPFSETQNEVLFLKKPSCSFQVDDKDVNIDIETENFKLSINKETCNSKLPSKSSLESVTFPEALKNSKTKMKKRKSTKKLSHESKITQPPKEEINFPQWLTENPSISKDIPNELRNLIQFHDNPLNELPVSNAVGPMIKLNNKLNNVTDAVQHLKKYSSEKFIFNVNGLKEDPMGKKSFEENFKLVVQKTVKNHVQQKLDCYRRSLADVIINDSLEIAITAAENVRLEDFKTSCNSQTTVAQTESSPVSTQPVAMKAFSFS